MTDKTTAWAGISKLNWPSTTAYVASLTLTLTKSNSYDSSTASVTLTVTSLPTFADSGNDKLIPEYESSPRLIANCSNTVTAQVAVNSLPVKAAVMCAIPRDFAVTRPSSLTVATASLSLDQVTVLYEDVSGATVACNVCVAPFSSSTVS